MAESPLVVRLRTQGRAVRRPDGVSVTTISGLNLRDLAAEFDRSLREVEIAALELAIVPERYLRNQDTIPPRRQIDLLQSRVLLVGLGGLGGYILDQLARSGIGRITAADGDRFDESNLNRQLLATGDTIGRRKALAARERVAAVNPAVECRVIDRFLVGDALADACTGQDLIIDALGGHAHRLELQRAAADARSPLVTAAVAGWAGYVAVVHPGEAGPAEYMDPAGASAEDSLGTPAPTVAFAASLACAHAVRVLLGQCEPPGATLLFDLQRNHFERITLQGD